MGEPKPLTAYQQTYHWRNKNCAPFAHDWVKKSLPGLKVEHGPASAEIVEVTSVSGDCDLGQRKGKLLTIYDLEVEAKWTGKAGDGSDVEGTLKIPEVSHEAIDGLSDYVFEWRITSASSGPSSELLSHIKSSFPPVLTSKLNTFRAELLAAYGNPSADDSPAPSGTSTPQPGSSSYSPAPPAKPVEAEKKVEETKKDVGKTVTVEQKADLQASAEDLWGLLTDENKVPMWSRSAAKINLTPDAPYELFGGNVRGKIISVEAPKKLVQTWQVRSPSWPSDHYGKMTLTLDQGSSSTAATFTLDSVPVGNEAEVEKALDAFYIRGLKQMGLVLSFSSRSYSTPLSRISSTARSKPKKLRKKTSSSSNSFKWSSSTLIGSGVVVALSAVLVGIVYTSLPSSSSRV
ncbi:chaperone activator [Kwoniella mangroviensis CBS 8886]|uniref:uncharacterized protein n=1 Tax=Kwoniella mangroviensis CBS 8507 TaxID=1296122 RepID=UPI00080D771A|nr:chaperone activator [Kwoniella mangroviensis CBS 8507]OCF70670.1 chaperone activator [Kwoniella mangroviensis CBS 8507]OCF74763.1 chaperone activator [Kwoniella mangroviensis CBS 8886]